MEWLTSEDVFISESIFESIFTFYLLLPFWGGEGGGKMHLITRRVHLPLIMKRTRLTSACNVGDQGSIPGSGRSSGEGNGNPLQYSHLENPMDRESHGQRSLAGHSP